MVNAALNWASLVGLLLALYAVVAAPSSIAQIVFLLGRRADRTAGLIVATGLRVIQAVGRFLALPLCGGILFFQGWRLDPILQLCLFLLAIGLIFESVPGIVSDYRHWQQRRNRPSSSV